MQDAPDSGAVTELLGSMLAALTPREGGVWVLVRDLRSMDDGPVVRRAWHDPAPAARVIADEIGRDADASGAYLSVSMDGACAWEFDTHRVTLRLEWVPIEPGAVR
ncbi:hypothetical protein ACTWP5_18250 [Streptomyces sp. 4N509B]|uniref:hypothetical protein n=1 Tax=Streptomyces sp. 4N509B TaxID=3457413 RepID=UPI003FD11F6E